MTALPVAAASLMMAAAAGRPVTTIDLAACLRLAGGRAKPDSSRCPGFMSEAFKAARDACREAGGKLAPAPTPALWELDVNGDRRPEYLFEIGANVACEGAYSVFECGSGGCPYSLVEQQGDAWRVVGVLDVPAPESIEVLAAEPDAPYRELRVGCAGDGPCDEFSHYTWTRQGHALRRYQVRGRWVDVGASAGGLRSLTREIAVRATPDGSGALLGRYGRETEVVILGEVPGTPGGAPVGLRVAVVLFRRAPSGA